ncbi:MAG: CoA protein activase [Desulfitibacter sp. BRH_c19]|nr:MAG: CoA protein activase [Desulfitibacter sp. BRH_c19]
MKVSFPRMGTSHIAFKHFVERLGHEVIIPPTPSKQTLSYGVQYSPEFACIPFKVLLGTYVEVLEKGAEMIISSGGHGPCRAGLYGMLHEKILKNAGYDFEMVTLDAPLRNLKDFISKINRIIKPNKIGWYQFYQEFKFGWAKLKVLDEVDAYSHKIRPYEVKIGQTTKQFQAVLKLITEAQTINEIDEAKHQSLKLLDSVEQDRTKTPLKVGIIGEIYVVIEPFMNFDIQVLLGEMGVETHRSIYLTQWTKDNVVTDQGELDVIACAPPYLNQKIGGHGINSIGETVLYSKKGYDGVIQLAPFTCIPEIVAKSIMPQVSKDFRIPVLSLTIDEQTARAGVQTRLEAFIDLMLHQRSAKGGNPREVLIGN